MCEVGGGGGGDWGSFKCPPTLPSEANHRSASHHLGPTPLRLSAHRWLRLPGRLQQEADHPLLRTDHSEVYGGKQPSLLGNPVSHNERDAGCGGGAGTESGLGCAHSVSEVGPGPLDTPAGILCICHITSVSFLRAHIRKKTPKECGTRKGGGRPF